MAVGSWMYDLVVYDTRIRTITGTCDDDDDDDEMFSFLSLSSSNFHSPPL